MARNPYFPTSERLIPQWGTNFILKFTVLGPGMGFTALDITTATNDVNMMNHVLTLVEWATTHKEQRVALKNKMLYGPAGGSGAIPPLPALPVAPVAVLPDIIARIANLIVRIKASANYTEAIGKELGIIGEEQVKDLSAMRPTLKLVLKGASQVEVQWNKSGSDYIHIESDKGNGWEFLARDTKPHYMDTTPLPTAPTIWKYRAIYVVNDERAGTWSATESITVVKQ